MDKMTPAGWLATLERRLDHRWSTWKRFDDYYEGDQKLAFVTAKFRSAFGNLFRDLTDNFCPLIVDSSAERIRVQGFRFGDESDADDDAWRIWQANGLDAQANMIHTEAIKLGESYWLVQPNGDVPKITAEHPSQVIVACAPGDTRTRLAALKRWMEDDGSVRANVYLPEGVVKYQAESKNDLSGMAPRSYTRIDAIPNPLGVVPIVPMPNNPSMLRGGRSDLAGGPLQMQDAINKTLADMLIGSEYQALPQRVLLGVEPPRDPNTGEVVSDLKAMQSRLWYFNNENAKAHEFSAADLENFRSAIDGLISDLASQSRTPAHYFKPQSISNLSAEALKGLETGLVSKVRDKFDAFGEGHEEIMRLGFRSIDPDDPRASETSAETIWADPESRSTSQTVDAVAKQVALGLPFEIALEQMGYGPTAISRILAIQATDDFLAPEPSQNGAGVLLAP